MNDPPVPDVDLLIKSNSSGMNGSEIEPERGGSGCRYMLFLSTVLLDGY
jgi:hypothetical protein